MGLIIAGIALAVVLVAVIWAVATTNGFHRKESRSKRRARASKWHSPSATTFILKPSPLKREAFGTMIRTA